MRITVKLFAILRERAGTSELSLDLPDDTSADDAASRLMEAYPALRDYLPRSAFAINRAYAHRGALLHDQDELAIIPPVSGG